MSRQSRFAPVLNNKGAMQYYTTERKNPITKQVKIYATRRDTQPVSFQQLVEEVAYSTTMTAADVSGVLTAVGTRALEYLKSGNSVDLGPLGTMHITLKSGGALNAKDWKTDLIRNLMVRWKRPVSWLRQLNPANIEFTHMNPVKETTSGGE